jgi:HEAT repeat protein
VESTIRAEELLRALPRLDKASTRRAVDELIELASADRAVAVRVEKLLAEAEPLQRWPLAYVLGHLEPLSPVALRALVDGLDHPDPEIRWVIALLLARRALREIGVRSAVADLLRTGTETQRRMALYCLRALDTPDADWLAWLEIGLADPDPRVRVAAITSSRLRPKAAGRFVDLLIEALLADPDPRARCAAAAALCRIAAPVERARSALRRAASDPDRRIAKAAEAALALLEKKGPA